ncbi:hypothetical protein Lalb_Chr09g0328841 [Lupinus albus]|uniref:Beta-glucosidase n=1 Tax=Lupinus albus TaxID=3870 RepID=A0A6A4Q1E8_LUPAL|nr:hypothetical protein Lalb_Chr09g0328841 [Lupinus albus]
MALKNGIILILLVVILSETQLCTSEINRASFPNDFFFGTGSSALQVCTYLFIICCIFSL